MPRLNARWGVEARVLSAGPFVHLPPSLCLSLITCTVPPGTDTSEPTTPLLLTRQKGEARRRKAVTTLITLIPLTTQSTRAFRITSLHTSVRVQDHKTVLQSKIHKEQREDLRAYLPETLETSQNQTDVFGLLSCRVSGGLTKT